MHETSDTPASRGLIHTTSDVTTIAGRLMHGICDTLAITRLKSETFDSLAPRRLSDEICDTLDIWCSEGNTLDMLYSNHHRVNTMIVNT